jgi:GntR family transcriptional regulator, transcriptional repressor for pyruvate dehydrogenase complex
MSRERVTIDGRAVRVPVSHSTVRRIQQMISAGEIKPGDKLPSQRTLSEQLNVSRPSLREALSVLETLGYVRVEPGRGAVVCSNAGMTSPPRWCFGDRLPETDVFQLRMLMETYTARMAALAISSSQVCALRNNLEAMREAIRAEDLEASARLDLEFHRLIIDYAGNRMFAQIYASIAGVMLELHRLPLTARGRLWEPITEHENIIQALERHDPDSASYYMRLHLIRTAGRAGIDEARCSSW